METDSGVNSSSHSLEIFTSDIGDEDGKSLSGLSVSKNWNWKENSMYWTKRLVLHGPSHQILL